MATITVVAPAVIYPGADSYFAQFTEVNSTALLARRIVYLDTTPEWNPIASDATAIVGQNQVAGSNITSGKVATDVFVWVPSTIIEINSNATGTDPVVGQDYDTVVSSNAHQLDQSDTTPGSVLTVVRLSPRDTSGDTNVRVWVKVAPSILQFVGT